MYGADADALSDAAHRFSASAETLAHRRAELDAAFMSAGWSGPDAELARADWRATSAPALGRVSVFLDQLGARLQEHAAEQRGASSATAVLAGAPAAAGPPARSTGETDERVVDGAVDGVVDGVVDAVTGVLAGIGDALDEVVDDVVGGFTDVLADVFGGSDAPPDSTPIAAPVDGLRPELFGSPSDGRDAVLAAMEGFADGERIGRDEVEIRALDNGRYVVVLPGVTDLSEGFDQFIERVREDGLTGVPDGARDTYDAWADNDEDTVRKMRYAFEAALRDDTTVNEYSTTVIDAMEAAGVPAGADVMIVGHSFGAYTAMDLAAEASFNAAHGDATAPFHLNVTHVVAAGAETDWRFDEVPAGTNTLVLNNRFDAVYRAEDLLHDNESPDHAGHVEANFWGGFEGYGHDEHNYIEWLDESRRRDDVNDWLDGVGELYASGGVRVSVRVPDPALD
ncbi:MAG: hypothetical protein QNJ12_15815 [Ilumatobacter sp.]|uniref:hypothetical protein n=1 Tax=Ilumatobacter sp. TaxID=1967498 RepID=UPI00262E02C1|nr:hypothetical protein [Ilumatobacter sp.]MDJ0770265.1 hypothetical protein [Ilumatobacter sp.]